MSLSYRSHKARVVSIPPLSTAAWASATDGSNLISLYVSPVILGVSLAPDTLLSSSSGVRAPFTIPAPPTAASPTPAFCVLVRPFLPADTRSASVASAGSPPIPAPTTSSWGRDTSPSRPAPSSSANRVSPSAALPYASYTLSWEAGSSISLGAETDSTFSFIRYGVGFAGASPRYILASSSGLAFGLSLANACRSACVVLKVGVPSSCKSFIASIAPSLACTSGTTLPASFSLIAAPSFSAMADSPLAPAEYTLDVAPLLKSLPTALPPA